MKFALMSSSTFKKARGVYAGGGALVLLHENAVSI